MNLSGRSRRPGRCGSTSSSLADLLVVCDDLNLPLGKLRIRGGGSDGGQKGLRDITAHLGTEPTPGSGSGSATAGRSTPPTSSSAGSEAPNGR